MRHHDWVEGGPREDLHGENWWTCSRCGARDSAMSRPWVERTNGPVMDGDGNWYPDGTARRVSMRLVTQGGSPAWMNIGSDCDLELVGNVLRT